MNNGECTHSVSETDGHFYIICLFQGPSSHETREEKETDSTDLLNQSINRHYLYMTMTRQHGLHLHTITIYIQQK